MCEFYMPNTCNECRYFILKSPKDKHAPFDIGECHRHAPMYTKHSQYAKFPELRRGTFACGDIEINPKKLKKCPVCGSYEVEAQGDDQYGYYVYCNNCEARTKDTYKCDEVEEHWNNGEIERIYVDDIYGYEA